MIIRSQQTPVVHCMSRVHLTVRYVLSVMANNTAEKRVIPSRKVGVPGHTLYIIFDFISNMESYYGGLVGEFCFNLYSSLLNSARSTTS
jgi:hypothetical protein